MKRFFQIAFHVGWMTINLLAAIALLLADCSVWIDPSHSPLIAILGLGFEWLFWLNMVLALSWLLTSRKKCALLGLAVLLLSCGSLLNTYSHGKPSDEQQGEHALTVMTYNTHMTGLCKKVPGNDVLRYVKESGADVVCLQEYEVRKNAAYLTFDEAKRYLSAQYPYTYYDFAHFNNKRQFGVAVYSRYPLINKQTIRYESVANISNRCDILVGDDTIRLFNNHLESNRFVSDDLTLSESEFNSDGLKKSVLMLVRKMKNAYQFRAAEVKMVREAIDQSPYPVVVVGDMNDVPVSFTYHTLSKGLQDAFLKSSIGRTGHTFVTRFWGVRIDYIFVDKQFHIEWCEQEKVPYSDHFPLSTTISW